MPYELRTFGGLDLFDPAGERVEAVRARSKGMALLVYLAVEAREEPVGRGQIAALLWPGRDEDHARNALRVTLTRVRGATERPLIGGKGEHVLRLAPGRVESDATAFERALDAGDAEKALELYTGPFLAGFQPGDAAPFDRWADQRRERYRDRAYDAALSTGEEARRAGDLEAATAVFERALEIRPLREEAAASLVLTLAERGRTAEALERSAVLDRRRQEELELPPSERLRSLVAKIRAGDVRASPPPPSADSEPPPVGVEASGSPATTSDTESPGQVFVLGVAVLALAVAIFGLWGAIVSDGGAEAGSPDPSVAVLPFERIGGDEGDLAAGLHTDLLTRLSHVSGLDVISGISVARFEHARLPLPAIADSLDARWVVEGTVERSDEEIEVNVQLIDPRTDTHAWAETYRRRLTADNLFDVESEISRRVARVLAADVASAEEVHVRRRPTESLEAHRFYVRGRSLLEQRDPPEMQHSLAYFDQALAVDSTYALAWAGRADALSILARYPGFDPDTLLPRASHAVGRALGLEPDLAEAHATRGRLHMYRREGPEALRAFERAIALRPSFAAAHAWLAKLQLSLGRPAEALTNARRSVELDPLSAENHGTLVYAWLAHGEPERALEVGRRVTEIDEVSEGPSLAARLALSHLPRVEELRSATHAVDLDAESAPILAAQLVAAGDSSPARAWLARTGEEENPWVVAWMHASLGDADRGLAILRRHFPRADRPWDPAYNVFVQYFWPRTLGRIRDLEGFRELEREMHGHWGLEPDGSIPAS